MSATKNMNVKMLKIGLLLAIVMLTSFIFPKDTQALCDAGKTGPKLGNRLDFLYGGAYPTDFIRTKYNDHNGSCPNEHIAVTILLSFNQVASRDPTVTTILNQMHSQNMYPIIRLITNYTGSGFTTITETEAAAAGAGLADLVDASEWNTNEIIVYPGNEINSDAEWPDPSSGISYGDQLTRVTNYAKIYSAFSQNTGGEYRVYLPPLNAYLGVCQIDDWNYNELLAHYIREVRSNGGRIDGAAFTVYNANSDSIKSDIAKMATVTSANGVSNYIISEVGPKLDEGGVCRLLDQAGDVDEWKSRMSEVFTRAKNNGHADVFLAAEKATTSYFLNCNNQLTTFLVVIGEDGDVTIEEEGDITCDEDPPPATGNRPLEKGFYWGARKDCFNVRDDEFHPLRPYPVSPCDPLIPQSKPEAPYLEQEMPSESGNLVRVNKYINYACGTSINFEGTESFNPHGYGSGDLQDPQGTVVAQGTNPAVSYAHTVCEPETYVCRIGETCPTLTCYRTLRYEVKTDFRDSNLGFLGNTQTEYANKELVNNYMSWYFTGVPQIGDHEPLKANSAEDQDLLINYAGPVRKLLPFDAQNAVRSVIASAHGQQEPLPEIVDVHNYIVGCKKDIDWAYFWDVAQEFFDVSLGNIVDLFRFMKLLWDTANSQAEGFVRLGALLYEIASNPELLEEENRLELIELIVDSGFESLLTASFDFIAELISIGADNIRRLAELVSAVRTDVAESCDTSDDVKRLDYFENRPYPDGHLPPDPHDDRYDDFDEFWDDYQEWQGVSDLPFIGFIISPFLLNTWGQLFPNIPLSGLEDIAGEEFFTGYGQGVGPYSGSNNLITAPGQVNILEAVPAVP